ncbi:type II secretion system GspH family protein [Rubripirellula amarantea]|nr:type II secretion system GspH family protein [Rubripirellula amarantea]
MLISVPKNANRRSAFTLIELVISAVLTSIMMTALLSVLWASLRQSNELKSADSDQASMTILAEQIRRDIQNARGFDVTSTGFLIHGFLGSDSQSGLPNLTPATVRYEVIPVNGRGVLYRREMPFNPITSGAVRVGVAMIDLQPLTDVVVDGDTVLPPETGGLSPMPSALRLSLISQNGRLLISEVIQHHAD